MALKVLDPIQQIQHAPSMWIEIDTPEGIIREVIENAADEVLNGYGDTISLYITPFEDTVKVTIADNGRGIPLTKVKLPDGREMDSVIAICTKLFSGEKFDGDVYQNSIGLHGVGLVVVNALSRSMKVNVKGECYHFKEGQFIGKRKCNTKWSTEIEFIPEPKYFEEIYTDIAKYDKIHDLLKLLAIRGINVYVNDTRLTLSLDCFIEEKLGNAAKNVVSINGKTRNYNFTYWFSISSEPGATQVGYVNFHKCTGTHVSAFTRLVADMCSSLTGVSRNIFANRIACLGIVTARKPRFSSQAKTEFINTDIRKDIQLLLPEIKKVIGQFDSVLNEIKKQYSLATVKKAVKRKLSADNPLKDCRYPNKGVLYILEGDSASSTLIKCRDPNTEAVILLGGKIPNMWKAADANLNNIKKEVKWLLEAVGWQLKKDWTPRYPIVRILADPDPDGLHIAVLTTVLFYEYARQLITNGILRMVLTPIYLGISGSKYFPIYTRTDAEKVKNKIRIKGLAQIPPDTLRTILDTPKELVLNIPEDITALKNIITSNMKRELLSRETLGFVQLLETLH